VRTIGRGRRRPHVVGTQPALSHDGLSRFTAKTVRLVALSACIGMALQARPPLAQAADAGQCDPNYSGQCVPIASDVDCAGGKGNEPAFVTGPVYVVGSDIYGLGRDKDGVGCE
jgi:resuscitation-promoting factor RpfB